MVSQSRLFLGIEIVQVSRGRGGWNHRGFVIHFEFPSSLASRMFNPVTLTSLGTFECVSYDLGIERCSILSGKNSNLH